MDDIKRNDFGSENNSVNEQNFDGVINPHPLNEKNDEEKVYTGEVVTNGIKENFGKPSHSYETADSERTVFTEKVKKPKKERKNLWAALGGGVAGGIIAVVLAIAIMSAGSAGSFSKSGTAKIYTGKKVETVKTKTSGEALSDADIIDKVGPAVVGLVCEFESQDWFWGSQTQEGSGSGVIINEDGYIVTNNHVVEDASKITVTLISGESYEAKIIGTDSRTDIAVIKIEPKGELTYAAFGDSSTLRVGDSVIAIGNPLGEEFAGSASKGIISATNRTLTVSDKTLTVLQTDAAINPGNSGGALVNDRGEVIGINTAKISDSSVEGLGFSIPSNEFMPVIEDLIENGHVTGRPLIGISGREITEQLSENYGYPIGVYVVEVSPFSGAEDAGIKNKDVITEVNGEKVSTVQQINDIRDKFKAGDKLKMKVYRKSTDKTFEVEVTLGEDTDSSQTSADGYGLDK